MECFAPGCSEPFCVVKDVTPVRAVFLCAKHLGEWDEYIAFFRKNVGVKSEERWFKSWVRTIASRAPAPSSVQDSRQANPECSESP